MGRAKLGLMAVALVSLAGCGSGDVDDARESLARWKERGPQRYVYVVQRLCFCDGIEPVRVVVDHDAVLSSKTQSGVTAEGQTMTALLEEVVRVADSDPDELKASYDESLGYLKRLDVDQAKSTDDDEYTIIVSCFGEGTGDDVCA